MPETPRSRHTLVLGAALAAAICAALGTWQISRHREKQAWIAAMNVRLAQEPGDVSAALADPAGVDFRRVRASGRYLAQETVVVENRHRGEQSGVHVLTPLEVPGLEALLLVDRGFVPRMQIEEFLARDAPGEAAVEGVLQPVRTRTLPAAPEGRRLRWPRLDVSGIEAQVRRPLAPALLVRAGGDAAELPQGGIEPPSSRVNHLHYVVTWYGIAAIAASFAVASARRREPAPALRASRRRPRTGPGGA